MIPPTKPREVPFLFKGEMVRALLNGTKTETRRLQGLEGVNESPHDWKIRWQGISIGNGKWPVVFKGRRNVVSCYSKCCPGDVIWVKETFLTTASGIRHKADFEPVDAAGFGAMYGGWKPSIFMRREYSRIVRPVVEVRCERLQDVTEEGAKAEGAPWILVPLKEDGSPISTVKNHGYRCGFAQLWDEINGSGSWNKNPFVFVYRFREVARTGKIPA